MKSAPYEGNGWYSQSGYIAPPKQFANSSVMRNIVNG